MDIPDFIDLYNKSQEKELEQKVWEMWLSKYPHMTEETYISYYEMLRIAKQTELNPESNTPDSGVYIDQCFI
jgi:hypothetical protein